jgi:hypothetical protein
VTFSVEDFRRVTKAVVAAEKIGSWSDWTEEQRRLYEAGNWRVFSKARGYTDAEIEDYATWLRMVSEAIAEDINPLIFIGDFACRALERNRQHDKHGELKRYLHKPMKVQTVSLLAGDLTQVIVADDFLEFPDAVRQSAMESGFDTWRPNQGEVGSSVYDGVNFWGDHESPLRCLAEVFGRPIFPRGMFFRMTNAATEGAYVHSDRESGDFTAIVYLSKHDDSESGTAFYRHRETGLIRMPSFAELRKDPALFEKLKRQMVAGESEAWELLHFVPGKYNRALIFHAPLFHARIPRHGFGSTAEDGRLIWAAHFGL